MGKSGVRLPILPVRVYSSKGSKLVYALVDSGSEESLISRCLFEEFKFIGIPLKVLLITAMGAKKCIPASGVPATLWQLPAVIGII